MQPAWKNRLQRARQDVGVLVVAVRHPRTPWYARALLVLVVAYAASPIDLIPDAIPIIGLVDDAILLPLGIALVRRMIPPDVMQECRDRPSVPAPRGLRWTGLAIVALLWIGAIVGSLGLLLHLR